MKLAPALLLLALTACRSEPPAQPSPDAAAQPAPAPDAVAPAADTAPATPTPDAAPAAPEVVAPAPAGEHEPKLVEAGAEPRAVLEYAAAQGFEQTLELTMTLALAMDVDGQPVVSDLPKTRMTLGAKVVERRADALALAIEVKQAAVDGTPTPGAATRLAEVIADLGGLAGTKVVDLGGRQRSLELTRKAEVPAAVAPVLEGFEQALDQMLVPLPREAVGVGARWEVRHAVTQAGVRLTQVTTYTLEKVEGRKLSLKLEVTLAAGEAGASKAALPGGLAATLDEVKGRGEGALTVDLDALYPTPLRAKNTIALALGLEGPPKKTMKVDMSLELTTGP